MSYLVLARKYRPQTFDEVVGQGHVTTTLTNAINADRVAHAILFSGPRGTGKTTVARILAKTLNCEQNRETPSATPCNNCRSCREITSGSAADVFEIDGASNNSVDQVRDLRENARYMPAQSPFKIYIIDEVHMLSTAAFNALLKTLEEPPAHVKFMFATTEPHKIPITILSRCQRHDMRRVESETLIRYMGDLCSREEMSVDTQSLGLIAQESGGSVRDSLSLLDQVLSCSAGEIGHDQVLSILGTVDRKNLFDLSSAILSKQPEEIITLVTDIYNRGNDLKKFYAGLTEHFRNLLVVRMTRSPDGVVDLPAHELEQIRQQTAATSPAFLSQILDILFKEESTVRFAVNPKIAVEIALLKLLQIEPALTMDRLIDKIDILQTTLASGTYAAPAQPETTPAQPSVPTQPQQSRQQPPQQQPVRQYPEQQVHPQVPPASNQAPPASNQAPPASNQMQPMTNQAPPAEYQTPQHDPARPPQQQQQPEHPTWNREDPHDKSWDRFKRWFATMHPPLAPSLADSRLKSVDTETIDVEISGTKFNIQRVMDTKNHQLIETACRKFFGPDVSLTLTPDYKKAEQMQKKKEQSEQRKQEALSNPVVAEAVNVFNGHIDTKLL